MSQVRVDFYLLKDDRPDAMWHTACRLLEKAHLSQLKTFVCCKTKEDAILLDSLLWTYKDESFIPHALSWDESARHAPIEIGIEYKENCDAELILNLTPNVPLFSKHLQRIMEIVPADDEAKSISREHYRAYRAQALELYTHNI